MCAVQILWSMNLSRNLEDPDLHILHIILPYPSMVRSLLTSGFLHFQANVTRTNHIMWTMGTDFKYQYANTWFRQMDKLIHYVNKVSLFFRSSFYTSLDWLDKTFVSWYSFGFVQRGLWIMILIVLFTGYFSQYNLRWNL